MGTECNFREDHEKKTGEKTKLFFICSNEQENHSKADFYTVI